MDASIQYCSALEILNLDYNGSGRIKSYWYPTLETLTEEIGRLKKLKILSLKYNKIKLLPRSIENLSNLEELYLEGNPLTALPENIGRLKKIKHLKIKSLSIKSLPESFSNLDSLESLELSDLYKLTAIPKSFGELKSLKKLLINSQKLNIKNPSPPWTFFSKSFIFSR